MSSHLKIGDRVKVTTTDTTCAYLLGREGRVRDIAKSDPKDLLKGFTIAVQFSRTTGACMKPEFLTRI